MHRIARDRLLDLRKQGLRIAYEQITHVLTVLEFILEQLNRTANRMALELRNASIERDPAVHGGEETECAFAPDVGGLDCGAILQNRQQRQNRTLRKIGMLQNATRIAEHLTELEFDRLEMGIYPLAAGRLQGAEQAIAPRVMICVLFGHCLCR